MPETSENCEIRQADIADAKVLAMLGVVTFFEAYYEQDAAGDLANYVTETFAVDKIASEFADPATTYLIAYRGEKAVGYAKLIRDAREDGVTGVRPIELKRIYTVERVWGTGVGLALLEHCRSLAKSEGFDTLWLGVWQENQRGQNFYRKHGFRKVGTITFPYGDSVGINDVLEIPL